METLMKQMNRPVSVPQSFSAGTRLGLIPDEGDYSVDPNEIDDDDYVTSDSDEDDEITKKVKTMEDSLKEKFSGKKTKTWNFVKRLVSVKKNRY